MAEAFTCASCGSRLNAESSFCGVCGSAVRPGHEAGPGESNVAEIANLFSGEGKQSGDTRTTTVQRVGVMSVGRIGLLIYGLIAGVIGVFLAVIILVTTGSPLEALGVLLGLTFGYGIAGFLGGLLLAWLYNVVAGWVGGIKIELK